MGVRQTSQTSGSWRASREGERRGAGFKQWPGKSLLRRDILTEEKEGTATVKAPKVCVTSNTVYPAGLQGLAVHGEDRAGQGISFKVPRDAFCYQAAGEWGESNSGSSHLSCLCCLVLLGVEGQMESLREEMSV